MSKNPFELLVDDAEDASIISIPVKAAAPAPAAKQPQQQQPERRQPAQQQQRDNKPRDFGARPASSRGGRGGNRQGQRQVNRQPDNTPFEDAPEHKTQDGNAKVYHGERRHGGRGGRRPNHGRDFDRRSANGTFKAGDKKEVAGKGTWGDAIKSEVDVDGNPLPPADIPVAADGETAPVEADGEAAETPVAEKEPEDNFKTLEQFMAEKEAKRIALAKENVVRKANEGSDESKWKNTSLLQKQDEELFADLKKAPAARKTKERATKPVEIEAGFAPPPRERHDRESGRGRGGRDGRGGARGGARGGRGGRSQPALNVNDKAAFPSLGGR